VAAAASIALLAIPAAAQTSTPPPAGPVITGRDLGFAAGATLGAAVLSKFDVRLARAFADSGFHSRHPGFVTASKRASIVTETVLMATGGTVYAVARMRKDDATADVAFHTTESVAAAAMFIQVVRGALGRARPYVIDEAGEKRDSDPYDFELLHGFTSFNYRSFPSMHAMASFAVASALSQEMRVRDTPHRQVIAPVLYAAAAMPGLGRMVLDEHWASDIAMGVFLGVLSGQKVVGYSHDHPDNRVDNFFLGRRVTATATIGAQGLSLTVLPF
jgi:membrane-associated phospholipid phosphatase